MSTAQLVVTLVGLALGSGGTAALITALVTRRKTSAEATEILTGSVIKAMREFEQDAASARQELRAVRQELGAVQQELGAVRTEATHLATQLHQLRTAILAPDATVERLRALAQPTT